MSEPIYDQLTRQRYHGASTTTPGDHMNVIADIRGKIDEGVHGIEGWVEAFKERLPELDAEVGRITSSGLFKAAEAAVLTPAEEAIVTRLIGDLVSLRPAAVVDDQGPAEPAAA